MKKRRYIVALGWSLCLLASEGLLPAAENKDGNALRGKEKYEKQILPVLQEYCYDCHGDGMDKGNFVLDVHHEYAANLADKKLWDHVREIMSTHVMPPENKPQPTKEERQAVLDWIEEDVFWVDPAKPDPGHVTLRRLNRTEYNNTVRDVLKVRSRPAQKFPPEDTGYGYDNIGSVLSISPMLMEKYLRAARELASEAIWVRSAPRSVVDVKGSSFKVSSGNGGERHGMMSLFGVGVLEAGAEVKSQGLHRVTLYLTSNKAGVENAKFVVLVDGKEVHQGEVEKELDGNKIEDSLQRVSFDLELKPGKHVIGVKFLNDFYDKDNPDSNRRDRNLLVHSAHLEGPLNFVPIAQSQFLEWLLEGKKISPPQLEVVGLDFDHETGGGVFLDNEQVTFASSGRVRREIEIPAAGDYRITVVASANQAGEEPAKVNVKFADKDRTLDITERDGKVQHLAFTQKLSAGKHALSVAFVNDYYKDGKDRNVYLEKVQVTGPLGSETAKIFDADYAKYWVSRLGLKLFRRPIEKEDLEKLSGFVELAKKENASRQEAISLVLEVMLGSSKFLFMGAPEPVEVYPDGTALVDEFTLASRLSYFLWSSAPDDRLLELASRGELRKKLSAEVKRMLGDWKAFALTSNFAGQWLRLRDIGLISPNRRQFPQFYEGNIQGEMKRESEMFFDHIVRENRSALEILDSNYTFVNESLAKFYGLKDVKGKEFRKVFLEGTPRGGLLTQAGILTLTSHPTRTSPVKRGQFLLENVLGTPPPPAPQNVPAFEEDRGAKVEGTLRERFEAHRSNPSCASCHAFLDPFGFAFENFDAIGRYREVDNKVPVDASGKLLTGETFKDAVELRKLLVKLKQDDFTSNLIENMLIYSLGRGLEYSDKLFVRQLKEKAKQNDYRMQDIIISVVESMPFQRMRAPKKDQQSAQR